MQGRLCRERSECLPHRHGAWTLSEAWDIVKSPRAAGREEGSRPRQVSALPPTSCEGMGGLCPSEPGNGSGVCSRYLVHAPYLKMFVFLWSSKIPRDL